MFKDFNKLSAKFDPWSTSRRCSASSPSSAVSPLMLWNLRTVWSGTRRWPAKVWSIVLVFSAFIVLWVAFAFKLIGFGVNY